MSRWLTIAGVVLLALWAPFLYSELTSEPAEKRARAGVDEELDDQAAPAAAAEGESEPPDDEAEELEPEPEPDEVEPPPDEVAEPEEGAELTETATGAAEPETAEAEDEQRADDEAQDEPAAPVVSPVAAGPTAVLKSAFEVEHRDSFWAPGAEARIAAIFDQVEAPEGALESAECRKRVCRVELAWSQEQAAVYTDVYGAIREQFGMEVGVEPIVTTPTEEGESPLHKVVLYLPRKGYSVSDLVE